MHLSKRKYKWDTWHTLSAGWRQGLPCFFCKLIVCDVHNRHEAIFLFCITVWAMCDWPGTEVWAPKCRPFPELLWKDWTRRFCSYYGPSMTLSTTTGQFCVCYSASLELQRCHLSVRWEPWYSMNWVWALNKVVKTFSAPPNSMCEGPEWSFSFHKMKKNTENKIHKVSASARSSIHPKTVSIVPVVPTSGTRTKSPEERLSTLSPEPDLWRVEPTFCTSSHHHASLLPALFLIRQTLVRAASKTLSKRKSWVACFTENRAWLWVLPLEASCLKQKVS